MTTKMMMRKPSSSSILTTKASLHQSRSAMSDSPHVGNIMNRNLNRSRSRSTGITSCMNSSEKFQIQIPKMNYHTTRTSTGTRRIINNINTSSRANSMNASNNNYNFFQRFNQSKTNNNNNHHHHTITTPLVSSIMAFMMIMMTTANSNNYDDEGIMMIGTRNDNTNCTTLCSSIDKSSFHPSPTPVGVGKESNFEDKVDTVDNLHLPVYTR